MQTDKITLKDAMENYIAKRSDVLSPSTIRGYKVIQNSHYKSVENIPASSVDWQKEINLMAKKYAPKTIRNSWRFVVSVLDEAGIKAPKVTLPQQEVKEREFLDQEQIRKFITAVKGKEVEIPALLALNSLRRSEIAALDWKDINLKSKTIYIHSSLVPTEGGKFVKKSTTKNSSSTRTIPIIIPALEAALAAVEVKSGTVCPMHINAIFKAVNTACKDNDLPLVGVHGLRHSFASLAYSIGLTEKQTMELGGWSDFGTMRRIYTHLDTRSKDEAREKMAAFFKSQNGNENGNGDKKV